MCQLPGAAVILQLKPPNIVLRLLQLFLSMSDADLTPPLSDYLHLKGVIPDPGHGIIDIIVKGVVEIKEGELGGVVSANQIVE